MQTTKGFLFNSVGKYNPDWAISFKEGKVKHVLFIAETKALCPQWSAKY